MSAILHIDFSVIPIFILIKKEANNKLGQLEGTRVCYFFFTQRPIRPEPTAYVVGQSTVCLHLESKIVKCKQYTNCTIKT